MEVSLKVADKAVSTDDDHYIIDNINDGDREHLHGDSSNGDDFTTQHNGDVEQHSGNQDQHTIEYFQVARLETVLAQLLENKFSAIKSITAASKKKKLKHHLILSPSKRVTHKLQRILSSSTSQDGHSSGQHTNYDSDQPCFGAPSSGGRGGHHQKYYNQSNSLAIRNHRKQYKRKKFTDSDNEYELSPNHRHKRRRRGRGHHRVSSRSPDNDRRHHSNGSHTHSPARHGTGDGVSPQASPHHLMHHHQHYHEHWDHHHHWNDHHNHPTSATFHPPIIMDNIHHYMDDDDNTSLVIDNINHLMIPATQNDMVGDHHQEMMICDCYNDGNTMEDDQACCMVDMNGTRSSGAQLKIHYDEDYISVNMEDMGYNNDDSVAGGGAIIPQETFDDDDDCDDMIVVDHLDHRHHHHHLEGPGDDSDVHHGGGSSKHRSRRKKRRRKHHHHRHHHHHHHHHHHRHHPHHHRYSRRRMLGDTSLMGDEEERVKSIDPDDLPQRARWTIVATACLLLMMCLLLVGVTLRMAPIIDEMVRKENEELMHSLSYNHAHNRSRLLTTLAPPEVIPE